MSPCSPIFTRLAVALIVVGLTGCASSRKPPEPLAPPQITASLEQFAGNATSGPAATEAAHGDVVGALDVRFEVIAAESEGLGDQLGALESRARLIVVSPAETPLLAAGQLVNGSRFDSGQAADEFRAKLGAGTFGRSTSVFRERAALPDGTCASIAVIPPAPSEAAATSDARPAKLELFVSRASKSAAGAGATTQDATGLELAVAIAGRADQPSDAPMTRELAVLGAAPDTAQLPAAFAVIVPFKQQSNSTRYLVVFVDVAAADGSPDFAQVFAASTARLRKSATNTAARNKAATSPGVDNPEWPALRAAIEASQSAPTRRAALSFLADRTHATWSRDVALVANDRWLEALVTEMNRRVPFPSPAALSNDALGWKLDQASIATLCQPPPEPPPPPAAPPTDQRSSADKAPVAMPAQSSEPAKLPPELTSVLLVHAGEAGRSPSTVLDLANRSATAKAFADKLVAENLISLEDASPAARVRAFDWLQSRGMAPATFDPLGTPRERRAALEQMAEMAAQPAGGGPKVQEVSK